MPTTLIEKIRNRKHCYECAYYNKIAAKCSRFNKPLSLWQIIGRVKCRSFVTPKQHKFLNNCVKILECTAEDFKVV